MTSLFTRRPAKIRSAPQPPVAEALPEKTPLTNRISYQLAMLAGLIDRQSTRILAPHGLNLVRWRILTSIDHFSACTLTQLLPHAAVDRALVCREIARLEEAGLIHSVTDPADRRRKTLSLTKTGASLHKRALRDIMKRQALLSEALNAEEHLAFTTITKKLQTVIKTDIDRREQS